MKGIHVCFREKRRVKALFSHYEFVKKRRLARKKVMKKPIFGKRLLPYLLLLTLPLYVADQGTKWWTVLNLEAPSVVIENGFFVQKVDGFPVIEGFFNWSRIHNTGVAWGFGNGSNWAPFVFFYVERRGICLIVCFKVFSCLRCRERVFGIVYVLAMWLIF